MMLSVIQHALGRDQYGNLTRGCAEYRNRFVTGLGSTDWPACVCAVACGLMKAQALPNLCGSDICFYVTPAGREYMIANSPVRPSHVDETRDN